MWCNQEGKECVYANHWHECSLSVCKCSETIISSTMRGQVDYEENYSSYCITFFPVASGVIDPLGCHQIFLKLTENKAEELRNLFRRCNEDPKSKIKIVIEKFK